jgi:CPA2 family monovalent cation:H+ antiporter-2
VVLCGFGRVGSAVGEAFDTFGLPYTVIERNPDVIRALRARGLPCVFGDAGQAAVLHAAGVAHAALVVVGLPDASAASAATRAVRALNPGAHVIARAHRTSEADELKRRGASAVVQPELEAAATVIRQSLAAMRMPSATTLAYLKRFRHAMDDAVDQPEIERPLPEVRELTLTSGRLAGQSLRQSQIRERFGVTVVAIRRADGSEVFNPAPESVLREGDHLRVFGLPEQIRSMRVEAETV